MTTAGRGASDLSPASVPREDQARISRVNRAHARLVRCLADARSSPADVLSLGTAIVLREHVARDERVLYRLTLGVR